MKASKPNNPEITYPASLSLSPPLFFVALAAKTVVIVVVMVSAGIVLAGITVPETVEPPKLVVIKLVSANTSVSVDPELVVVNEEGNNTVSVTTAPGYVVGGIVCGEIVLADMVIVEVRVTCIPRLLIGTALPTPALVY